MPIWLSFLMCLSATDCKTVPVAVDFPGLVACQHAGMLHAPEMNDTFAPYVVRKIRCSIGNPPAMPEGHARG